MALSQVPIGKFRTIFVNQSVLLINAGSLALGTLSTAVLGFAYWWFAARAFSPEAVGLAAAAISLMNLLAHLGEIGLGPFLLGEIGRQKKAGAFLAGALIIAFCASVLMSLVYLVVARYTATQLGSITGSFRADAFFAVGCALTGVALVVDQALVGLLLSGLQLLRNVVFSVQKLLFLGILGFSLGQAAGETDIYITWVLGQTVSILVVVGLLWYIGDRVFRLPDIRSLRPVLNRVFGHHALSIAVQAPGLILPFVVTVMLSPEVNAAFYAAWTLFNVALLIPASLSAVLFSVAVREPEFFVTRLRLSLGLSLLCGIATALIFLFFSHFILLTFNPSYAETVQDSLQYLGLGAFGMAIKYHYLAVQRVRRRLGVATIILIGGGMAEIAAAALGARTGGTAGLANMWVLVVSMESLLLLQPIFVASRRGIQTAPSPERNAGAPNSQAQVNREQNPVAVSGQT